MSAVDNDPRPLWMRDKLAREQLLRRARQAPSAPYLPRGGLCGVEHGTLLWAQQTNPLVHSMTTAGAPIEQIVAQLAVQCEILCNRIMELEAIAPRKVRTPDGVKVWRCPDHLIPEIDLAAEFHSPKE